MFKDTQTLIDYLKTLIDEPEATAVDPDMSSEDMSSEVISYEQLQQGNAMLLELLTDLANEHYYVLDDYTFASKSLSAPSSLVKRINHALGL